MNELSIENSFEGTIALMDILRGDEGCPWDKDQTPKSLAPMLLEECYELIDAIENDNSAEILEEIGDVLFHMAFQIHIGKSMGLFNLESVFKALHDKYIKRHPHVFAGLEFENVDELKSNWEKIKQQEKASTRPSLIDGIPINLPSLSFAESLQKKASKSGFDWDNPREIRDKVVEELDEIYAATNKEEIQEEYGDLLFTIVNAARKMGVNPEQALRQTNHKFQSRFKLMERISERKGVKFSKLTIQEKDKLWKEVKLLEKCPS